MRFRDKDKPDAAGQGGVRAVQQGALRHHRAQEPRHPARCPISRARLSASPRAIFRSGSGRRWRKQNGIKIASVKQSNISPAVREPMLSAGQVDAVTGFSYLSAINLKDRGVPADDLAVLRFADYGCEAYGFALIVNPAFAAAKPEAVKGFVRAVIGGMHLDRQGPGAAIERSGEPDGRRLARPRTRAAARRSCATTS